MFLFVLRFWFYFGLFVTGSPVVHIANLILSPPPLSAGITSIPLHSFLGHLVLETKHRVPHMLAEYITK